MTIEQKAKCYDDALKMAKKLYEQGTITESLSYVFPELKESEDDRIRKEIVGYLKRNLRFEWVAWLENIPYTIDHEKREGFHLGYKAALEKQGENKPTIEMITPEGSLGIDSETYNKIVDECIYGEQKPINKIEAKFKVGDWVVDNCGYVWKTEGILNQFYILESVEGGESRPTIEWVNKTFHLWTIQDAKDGDVLFMDNGSANCIFIYKSSNSGIINKYASYNNFGFEGEHYLVLNDGYVIPATKEQRDTLFAKMKDSGYEWLEETKELKKIEQKSAAWSEEDEKMCQETIDWFEKKCFPYALESENPARESIKWLKSLKQRIGGKQ